MKGKLFLFSLLLLLLYVIGCGKKAIIRKYYVLEPDTLITRQDIAISDSFPYKVDVREFTIAKAFSQPRIAVRLKSHKINYYYYHLWATHPSSAITYMVFRLVDGCSMFKKTILGFSADADYMLTGNIDKLEVIEKENKLLAHLDISFRLIDNRKDEVVVRTSYNHLVPVKDKSMNEFAAEISNLLKQSTTDYLIQVHNQLSSK
jgi:ABC-type uncharacterized transport system auxiliary subunit